MTKKVLRMIGILSAVMMLASGCTNNRNSGPVPERVDGGDAVSAQGTVTETVNLTAGRTGIEAEAQMPSGEETAALSEAAVALLNQVLQQKSGENTLLSPVSIDFALGMTENGAAGETLGEMEQTVNGGISSENLNPLMKHLADRFENSEDVNWNIADSIWFKDDGQVRMKDDFLNKAVSFYDAEVFLAPFDNQTLADINNWTSKETNGMIPEVLDQIGENARMYLINAIAFDGEWEEEYEEDAIHEDREFTNLDGSTSNVTMMGSTENRYFTVADAEGFIKPYKGGEYSFVGILPKEGKTPADVIKQMNDKKIDLAKAVREAEYTEVKVQIPEFSNDFDIELSDTYKALGMNLPFSEREADFSEMMEAVGGGPSSIWIGRIIHKTHIDVDRKGTRAAAATVVEMKFRNAIEIDETKRICLDRPFVYAIVENETGMPVFIGCQNSME